MTIWKTMKAWRIEEAKRCDVSESSIAMRLARGAYQRFLIIRRQNARVVFTAWRGEPPPILKILSSPSGLSPKHLGTTEYQRRRRQQKFYSQGLTARGTKRIRFGRYKNQFSP